MNGVSTIISALALLMAWHVNDHYPPWRSAHAEALSALAVLALAVATIRSARPVRGIGGPVAFAGALALIPLAQAAGGNILFFGDAWVCTLYLLAAACAAHFSSLAAAHDDGAWADTLATTCLSGALLSSVVAMIQRWSIDVGALGLYVMQLPSGRPPWGNLGQPNHLVDLFFLGMAGLVLLFERRRVDGAWAAAAALLLTFACVLTYSRTPMLLFGAALLWHTAFGRRLHLRTPRWPILALAAFWGGLFLAWPRLLAAMDIASLYTVENRAQAGPRTVIWAQLWDALWLQPWAGWGWNQVSVAQMAVAEKFADSRMSEFSHNLLLDLALWNGVPLALLITGLGGWWLARALRSVQTLAGAFGMLVMLLLLTHSMVEFPLTYLYFLVPFSFALGLVMHDLGVPMVVRFPRTVGVAGAAALLALAVVAVVDYWRMEDEFREMRLIYGRVGRPMVAEPPPLLLTEYTQLAAQHRYWLTTPRPGMSAEEIAWARDVSSRYGFAPLLYRYALIQGLNGDIDGARLTLVRLRNLHRPTFYEAAIAEIRQMAEHDHPELGVLLN